MNYSEMNYLVEPSRYKEHKIVVKLNIETGPCLNNYRPFVRSKHGDDDNRMDIALTISF